MSSPNVSFKNISYALRHLASSDTVRAYIAPLSFTLFTSYIVGRKIQNLSSPHLRAAIVFFNAIPILLSYSLRELKRGPSRVLYDDQSFELFACMLHMHSIFRYFSFLPELKVLENLDFIDGDKSKSSLKFRSALLSKEGLLVYRFINYNIATFMKQIQHGKVNITSIPEISVMINAEKKCLDAKGADKKNYYHKMFLCFKSAILGVSELEEITEASLNEKLETFKEVEKQEHMSDDRGLLRAIFSNISRNPTSNINKYISRHVLMSSNEAIFEYWLLDRWGKNSYYNAERMHIDLLKLFHMDYRGKVEERGA